MCDITYLFLILKPGESNIHGESLWVEYKDLYFVYNIFSYENPHHVKDVLNHFQRLHEKSRHRHSTLCFNSVSRGLFSKLFIHKLPNIKNVEKNIKYIIQ